LQKFGGAFDIGTYSVPFIGQIIGSSRYHGYDAERSIIEIGWSFLAAPTGVVDTMAR
jgi:hypothetical protein